MQFGDRSMRFRGGSEPERDLDADRGEQGAQAEHVEDELPRDRLRL
jgi:hypothetical protein